MKLTAQNIAVIEGDNYLSADIIAKGRLDVARDELEKYRQHIPVGGVVVDVGASLGDYTATFSEMVGPTGAVVAFEPHGPSFECLKHNTQYLMGVSVFNHAIGNNPNARVGIVVDTNNIGASRLELREDDRDPVIIDTLDTISRLWRKIDFLKIDAEGWEPLILDGAVETIRRFRPAILIEVNTWPLGKMGFTPADIWTRLDGLNYVYEKFDGPYGDVLCLPREKWVQA